MNEKGSSLVVVLLVSLIFSILGLSILAASINSVKRTEIRELEVETTFDSKQIMSIVLAKLQINLNNTSINNILQKYETPVTSPIPYDITLNEIIDNTVADLNDELELDEPITIKPLDDSEYKKYVGNIDLSAFKNDNYTRIYNITISNSKLDSSGPRITRNLTQNVILSPTPSFLQYAVGAYEKSLVINGSPDIIGNVFAPTLELNSKAKFINDSTNGESKQFYGPAIYGTLFTSQVINNRETFPTDAPFFEGIFTEKSDGMIGIPSIMPLDSNFVDMNFDETFKNKRSESKVPEKTADLVCNDPLYIELLRTDGLTESYPSSTTSADLSKIIDGDEEIKNISHNDPWYEREKNPKFKCSDSLYLIEETMLETYNGYEDNLFYDLNNTNKTLFFTNLDKDKDIDDNIELVFKHDNKFTLDKSLDLRNDDNEKGWLVVDGTLEITGTPSADLVIEGNILVNGNLIIKSSEDDSSANIYFDSTIYVKGESLIENVNIYGAGDPTDQKQLVLLSNKDLKIVRINEFEDVSTEKTLVKRVNTPPNLKAFFYTAGNATLYGVGSKFEIEGGVFARQQLTINAIRYNYSSTNITEAEGAISPADPNDEINSRFYVEYDKKVITDQLGSLPRVNRLQVIPDQLFIK